MSGPPGSAAARHAPDPDELAGRARDIRVRDLDMVVTAGQGHLGSDYSAIDILTALYLGGILDVDPSEPERADRDRFVLSKGHAAGALYCTLAEAGFLDRAELATFLQPHSRLSGHPDRRKVPGVETNTGPLGHGLPVGVGIALGGRITGSAYRTFVLCGDGELQEGSMWEAAMLAGHHGLDTLSLIVDRNRLQQGARTEQTNRLDPLGERFTAFGWAVVEVDGNDLTQLLGALGALPAVPGRPTCVVANTRKGSGVSFMSDNVAWHHKVPNADEYAAALAELRAAPFAPSQGAP